MAVEQRVTAGVRNAFARKPAIDQERIERRLRRANCSLGRGLGRIEWARSVEAYIRRTADLLVDGWTLDHEGPLSPSQGVAPHPGENVASVGRLGELELIEDELWSSERAGHGTARLTQSRRLPVYLNAIEPPSLASKAASHALRAAKAAAKAPPPRRRTFAEEKYWRIGDDHWRQTRAICALPFLTEAARCFAAGLFAAALWRRGRAVRTILIGRPRLRQQGGRLQARDDPAVVWPDGSGRWYWDGIAVPERIAAARGQLTADLVARIDNQELRRVVLARMGWERFLDTANGELRAQDDFGKLWATDIRLDGERTQLVEVVNATAEPDGSYRRYFLRVPPNVRTAREAVGWTFGFETADDYVIAASS